MENENTPSVDQPQPMNPLLSRIKMPGETFTLPSGGIFYKNGELDPEVKNAEVHVHPMTAIDEITIKTPDLLFSGEAVRQIFSRCIPQVLKPDEMLAKDIDFLLMCLRKVSYGDDMHLEHTHDCKDAKPHTYAVSIQDFIRATKRIDPTTVVKKFSVKLPNGQTVHLQPVRFKEFTRIMQTANIGPDGEAQHITPEQERDGLVDSLSSIILKVDDVTNKEHIKEWLKEMTPGYIGIINDNIDKTLEWGPEFETMVKCEDCRQPMPIMVPMNPLYFFT